MIILEKIKFFLRSKYKALHHEKYPEILYWMVGDELEIYDWLGISTEYKFLSVSENAQVYVEKYGNLYSLSIYQIPRIVNRSLSNREISKRIQTTSEYKNIIADFQESVKKLKEKYN